MNEALRTLFQDNKEYFSVTEEEREALLRMSEEIIYVSADDYDRLVGEFDND